MSLRQSSIVAALILCVTTAWGQSTREPHIGYLYPSGGQQGHTVRIVVGGQYLGGARLVDISGQGVSAAVVEYIRPPRNLQREQREAIQERLKEVRDKRLAELPQRRQRRPRSSAKKSSRSRSTKPKVAKKEEPAKKAEGVKLPKHPLLLELDSKSLRELTHIENILFFPRSKQQSNRQLAEMVLIEVTLDADAPAGDRELRLKTSTGVTNPIVFQVGRLPEIRELEPNDQQAYPDLPDLPPEVIAPKEKPLALPVLLNGQIMPGDVDRFRFRARKGQQLVMEAHARSLIPYLADAVPGWFQATLALYDAKGNEVAFADDYRFNPDPVLFYKIPADGEYELEIRDSIYRGREDFVYRIAVSERPFITQMFPLGAQVGQASSVKVSGWNLAETELPLDTQPGDSNIRQVAHHKGNRFSNSVPYTVDTLSERDEVKSNDTVKRPQPIKLPMIINGRINKAGDTDIFRFLGQRNDTVVAEVMARRLNSPLDSLLRLTDVSGKVLAWNDDHILKESHLHKDRLGLVTHHADSYLMAKLPHTGAYYVHLTDIQNHGGQAYGYRLRLSAPQPDFALRATPSSLYVPSNGIVPIGLHALRKDGFDGAIDVTLKDAPKGFALTGARIPAGSDRIQMTLKAPSKSNGKTLTLQLEGRAMIDGQAVSHPVRPADDVMQAFLYRHLVPARELRIYVRRTKSGMPPVELASEGPIRIPVGGAARVLMKAPKRSLLKEMRLVLKEPPKGLTLHDLSVVPQGLAFQLKADKEATPSRFANNLIIEAFREYTPKPKDGKPAIQKRYSLGIFPAIPIEIVTQ